MAYALPTGNTLIKVTQIKQNMTSDTHTWLHTMKKTFKTILACA